MQIGERRKYSRSLCLLILFYSAKCKIYCNIGIRVLNFSFILQGSLSFLLGIFLIFVRWPVIGIVVELYGCILLLGLASTHNFHVFITIIIIILILSKSVIMRKIVFSQWILAIYQGISLSDSSIRMASAISFTGELTFGFHTPV